MKKGSFKGNHVNQFNEQYLKIETREYWEDSLLAKTKKPILKKFYQYESDFVSHHSKALDLHFNPVLQLALGADSELGSNTYINTRGVELRGTLDEKISFYTFIHENQIRAPAYVQAIEDTTGVIPYEGFWKEFGGDGYDFLRVIGYFDFNITKHVSAQAGYGRNFIGNGQRSLILSDFSNSYPYVKITAEVWKFRYTNIYAELIADVATGSTGTLGSVVNPKKFFALHHLDFAVSDDFHVGLFESVLNGRPDSLGGNNFEIQYLNPVIFYGAIEQQTGSSGNVVVGLDFSWNVRKTHAVVWTVHTGRVSSI